MTVVVPALGFKLVSHKEGLCYELWRWKPERKSKKGKYVGRIAPAGWVTADTYPSSIETGLLMMLDRAINASPEIVLSIEDAVHRIEAAKNEILAAVAEASIGSRGGCTCQKAA